MSHTSRIGYGMTEQCDCILDADHDWDETRAWDGSRFVPVTELPETDS